ncbi:Protein kinase-like protein [Metarhizium robertsii ARSEF 23]|uniref:Protein kinase-like protein n=1 Tax=Metarhizium robertsii (strain ARSEF 23 / ATCC MYA-3075) TaxID=655844 RepID=E9F754_METRA|nr:Protein kinase-like protein [Metarhizium robertsii ARSEF 23]EFY96384.2 Protein kinase-like protein [Metarhizium robertsii ARSEF 23]
MTSSITLKGIYVGNKPVIVKRYLYRQYKQLTDGTPCWRDNYILERWADSEKPVVYYGQDVNGYRLLKRLGDWCWLARNTNNNELLTVKFMGRSESQQVKRELAINRFLRSRCPQSPHLCTIKDSFVIKHHLAKLHPSYRKVSFDAIAYPPTGTDLQVIHTSSARSTSPLPLSIERRVQCIKDIVRGVAELHSLGIVHGDIHPGNVALPPPPVADIEALLEEPHIEHWLEREDGAPTPDCLPKSVIKPVDLGFGDGTCRVLDFGYSFRHRKGAVYKADSFSYGAVKAIEFETSETTAQPFKVDSWYMGQLIYYILTNGCDFLGRRPSNLKSYWVDRMAVLENGVDEIFNEELPSRRHQRHFQPIIQELMHGDPDRRLSVQDAVARIESF